MTRPSGSARPIRLLQPASSLAWQPPPARPAREGPPPDPSVGVCPPRQPDPLVWFVRLFSFSSLTPLLLISFVLHPPPPPLAPSFFPPFPHFFFSSLSLLPFPLLFLF